jgi:flagellar protein FliT
MTALSASQVIATYESIAGITARMLAAAEAAEWEKLTALERDCAKLVATLQKSATPDAFAQQDQRRKFDLIRKILSHDAAIRRHTEPWMDQLKTFIDSAGKSRRLNQAYGGAGAGIGAGIGPKLPDAG